MTSELASALRAWRDRVQPAAVGLPAGPHRKSAGLRREELAALAGVSVDYLVRLEQGRAANPSSQVLASLARALRLTTQERDLLFRSAGVAVPSKDMTPAYLSPGLQRVLDRLDDVPVGVFTVSWDLVLSNRMWNALLGNGVNPDSLDGEQTERSARERNLAWRHFTGAPSPMVRTDEETAIFANEIVADLHAAASTYPHDRDLAALIVDLKATSPEFVHLWSNYSVHRRISERKTIDSPTVGLVTVDCDILTAPDSDLRLVVYTATPGSIDASKLDLLRVTGIQAIQG